jgi:hypothetical protein
VGVRSEEAWARGEVGREGESTPDAASANDSLPTRILVSGQSLLGLWPGRVDCLANNTIIQPATVPSLIAPVALHVSSLCTQRALLLTAARRSRCCAREGDASGPLCHGSWLNQVPPRAYWPLPLHS